MKHDGLTSDLEQVPVRYKFRNDDSFPNPGIELNFDNRTSQKKQNTYNQKQS